MTEKSEIDALLGEAESLCAEAGIGLESKPPAAPPPPPPRITQRITQTSADAPGIQSKLPPAVHRVLRIRVPIIVRLAHKKMSTAQVLGLAPGKIIEFDQDAEEPLDLLMNNRRIGCGVAVKVGDNFGLRITSILGAQGKLRAMRAS